MKWKDVLEKNDDVDKFYNDICQCPFDRELSAEAVQKLSAFAYAASEANQDSAVKGFATKASKAAWIIAVVRLGLWAIRLLPQMSDIHRMEHNGHYYPGNEEEDSLLHLGSDVDDGQVPAGREYAVNGDHLEEGTDNESDSHSEGSDLEQRAEEDSLEAFVDNIENRSDEELEALLQESQQLQTKMSSFEKDLESLSDEAYYDRFFAKFVDMDNDLLGKAIVKMEQELLARQKKGEKSLGDLRDQIHVAHMVLADKESVKITIGTQQDEAKEHVLALRRKEPFWKRVVKAPFRWTGLLKEKSLEGSGDIEAGTYVHEEGHEERIRAAIEEQQRLAEKLFHEKQAALQKKEDMIIPAKSSTEAIQEKLHEEEGSQLTVALPLDLPAGIDGDMQKKQQEKLSKLLSLFLVSPRKVASNEQPQSEDVCRVMVRAG